MKTCGHIARGESHIEMKEDIHSHTIRRITKEYIDKKDAKSVNFLSRCFSPFDYFLMIAIVLIYFQSIFSKFVFTFIIQKLNLS